MTGTDVEQFTGLLDVRSGELLPATVENAAKVLHSARALKAHINGIVEETTRFLVHQSEHQGTKTLHEGDETVTITGGPGVDYDATVLMDNLRRAGCPESRIEKAVVIQVSYKVDRAVLRQLAAANPEYRDAIEKAEHEVERPYRASLKLRRNTNGE